MIRRAALAISLLLLRLDTAAGHGRPHPQLSVNVDSGGKVKKHAAHEAHAGHRALRKGHHDKAIKKHEHHTEKGETSSFLETSMTAAPDGTKGMEVFETTVKLPGLAEAYYEKSFFEKCLKDWQRTCHDQYRNDEESGKLFCDTHLDRGHLKSRLLVPREHVRAHFDHSTEMNWRNKTVYEGLRLPRFSEEGYKKARVPTDLHQRFVKWFRANRHKATPEETPVTGMWCDNDYDNDDWVLPWGNDPESKDIVEKIREMLIPHLEEWTQQKIDREHPIIYGMRMYHRGSICAMHADEQSNHIISAIYHLDDMNLDEDWPLNVVDHGGRPQTIVSQPGDLVFYESASTPHGRQQVFQGEEFTNLFFHFAPVGWKAARDAAFKGMLPWDGNQKEDAEHRSSASALELKQLQPAVFRSNDKCLPYGEGPEFSGAWNTSIMRLAITHDGRLPAAPGGYDDKRIPSAEEHESLIDKQTQKQEEVEKRMMWWREAPLREKRSPSSDTKYLLFDIDSGGLNNIRIGWENAGLIAFHTGRTLVLPHAMPWYLIDWGPGVKQKGSTTSIEDFVNIPQLQRGLNAVSFAEFVAKEFPGQEFIPATKDAFVKFAEARSTKVLSSCELTNYDLGDKIIYVHDAEGSSSSGEELHRLFTCGDWNHLGEPRFTKSGLAMTPPGYSNLVKNHFVWHPEVFRLASKIVNSLGLFQYVALHARYNDFQFKENREHPQSIMDRWMTHIDGWLGDGDVLYVSTDGSNPEEFRRAVQKASKRPIKVVYASDMFDSSESPIAELLQDVSSSRLQQIKGPIEQVICTFAKVFIGTAQSTFTGYIEKMRESAEAPQHVVEGSEDVTRLIHTKSPSQELLQHVDKQLASTHYQGSDALNIGKASSLIRMEAKTTEAPSIGDDLDTSTFGSLQFGLPNMNRLFR